VILCILVPLTGACVAFLAGRRSSPWIGVVASAAALAAAVWQSVRVWRDGPETYPLGGLGAPPGIDLYIDGFACLMLVTSSSIMLLLGLYSVAYFRPDRTRGWGQRESFTPLWLLLFAALNSLFSSSDVFNLYVSLEVLTLAGVALVIIQGEANALTAALRYMFAAFLASMLYLMGVALIYAEFGVLDLRLLGETEDPGGAAWVALTLMTVGLMIKTALFPFHAWLPRAHASAPVPVSAMLSGLVVKASFYIILRLWVDAFPHAVNEYSVQVVGLLGALGIIWGSLQALREANLKLVIAHSTVSQVGYLFLIVPLVIAADPGSQAQMDAWAGGIYQLVSHAFAKASLFLCAGTILIAFGSDRMESLKGLSIRMPITAFAIGIAGVALIGLPPSGSFLAKWLLLSSAIDSQQWWWAAVIAAGTLLSGAYVFRVLRHAFDRPDLDTVRQRVPRNLELVSLLLAVVALTLGLRATEAIELIEQGAPFIQDPG
jgi:multicomponent Na+:H+ antiporter subunit D